MWGRGEKNVKTQMVVVFVVNFVVVNIGFNYCVY